jgi:uncharacterized RDD family membrane protein YckC
MKLRHIRWSSAAVLTLFVLASLLVPIAGTLGASATWSNGNYRFAGGTEPRALAFSWLFLILYLLLLYSAPPECREILPGAVRRFFAFWLDLFIAIFAVDPILGIPVTLMEWNRTGLFRWFFERETPVPSDNLFATGGALIFFAVFLLYFVLPLTRSRPTPGACIVGYRIVSDDGSRLTLGNAALRSAAGFVAMSMWPITPFIGRRRVKGKLWFDRVFNTHAVHSR